jgi:hypothetical protein
VLTKPEASAEAVAGWEAFGVAAAVSFFGEVWQLVRSSSVEAERAV